MFKTVIKRLFWLLFLNFIVSFLLTIIIWTRSGRPLVLNGKFIDIDFYNTLCGTFGIVGLGIAIYQIAQLRTEQEIRQLANDQAKIDFFIKESIPKINNLSTDMRELQKSFNNGIYSSETLNIYIARIYDFVNTLNNLEANQSSLNCDPIINCNNCVSLMSKLQNDFYNIVTKNAYHKLKKQSINAQFTTIIKSLSECETNLKS